MTLFLQLSLAVDFAASNLHQTNISLFIFIIIIIIIITILIISHVMLSLFLFFFFPVRIIWISLFSFNELNKLGE